MTTPVPPQPKRAGRPPKPPEELYSAEHRVRLPRAQLERWQAAAKARGVRLADATREVMDRWAAAPTVVEWWPDADPHADMTIAVVAPEGAPPTAPEALGGFALRARDAEPVRGPDANEEAPGRREGEPGAEEG